MTPPSERRDPSARSSGLCLPEVERRGQPPTSWQLTILGAPRTKKNHGYVVQRGDRKIHLPSVAYQVWEAGAKIRRPKGCTWPLPPVPLNCAAIFYREAERGDLIGFLQGLGDFLKARHIITDDVWLTGFDGSRLGKDAANPRVELILTRMDEIALGLLRMP